jgi:hypothetical protein
VPSRLGTAKLIQLALQLRDRMKLPESLWQAAVELARQHGVYSVAHPGSRHNIVERALKRAVLHRKNALFYRTLNGAQVGDLFMSLIHTCQLCGANSFDYLTELQRHAQELVAKPAEWMPWNYRETLARVGI